MFKSFFGGSGTIIKEAAKSPLGIIALTILVLAFLAYNFFKNESVAIRLVIFGTMFIIAILSFYLSIYPLIHPSNIPQSRIGKSESYAPYGLKFKKLIWKHTYFEDYSFIGEIECFIENVSNTNISNLPPQQGGWFGWDIKKINLYPKIYDNDKGNYNLEMLLFSEDKIIRRDIDGSDKKITLYTWQFKINPALPPGKSFHYGQILESKNTEIDAFTEKGSFAGMSSPFPVDTLISEIFAPKGYRFLKKGYTIRDSMGIEVNNTVLSPEYSSDGSKITWTVENPIPSLKYFIRIVIVKRT
ncbi:MAG: hypothetical protein WA277_08790 [Nitrospirota bacterium]